MIAHILDLKRARFLLPSSLSFTASSPPSLRLSPSVGPFSLPLHLYLGSMASTMVHSQSPKAYENLGFGSPFGGRRSRLSLVDSWVSLPSLRPVRTASSSISSSGTPSKASSHHSRASSLDISESIVVVEECETPKGHKIPDVDVENCPPAPKKARGMSRMSLACSSAYESSGSNHDLCLSPCYLY